MTFAVVELPVEICFPDGRTSGSRRGWVAAEDLLALEGR